MKFSKTLIVVLIAISTLAGCSFRWFKNVPFENKVITLTVEDPTLSFENAEDCIARQVKPTMSGVLFTYSSDKFLRFIVTFAVNTNASAMMYYTTKGNEVTLEFGNITECYIDTGCWDQSDFSGSTTDFFIPIIDDIAENFVTCLKDQNSGAY